MVPLCNLVKWIVQSGNTHKPSEVFFISGAIPFKPFEFRKIFKFHSDGIRSRAGFVIKVRQMQDCSSVEVRKNHGKKPSWRESFEDISAVNIYIKWLRFNVSATYQPPPLCDFYLPNKTGYMTSLNYPGSYPDNVYCSYRIQALPGHCSVKVVFQEFDLEQSSNCRNDYLQVQGERQCGTSLSQQVCKFVYISSFF